MKLFAVIPAYNEATEIAAVIERTRPHVERVIVVNDGSTDGTADAARAAGADVYSHVINRGLGASLGTGFEAARRLDADAVVTLDADGQHDPAEISKFREALGKGADFVIGSRLIAPTGGMPWYRVVANWLGNMVTFVLFGAWVTDSQSGFRGLSKKALATMVVRANRMEVSSELVAEARHRRLVFAEVPIKAIYTEYSLSKGQSFFVGIKMLAKLVFRRLTH